MTTIKHKSCLVLNVDYSPIVIIDWKTSISWYLKNLYTNNKCIDIIEYHKDEFIQGVNMTYKLPSVIKISQYINLHKNLIKFSRKNLFIRDNFTCQYCHKKFKFNQLTYDHVIPKSQWKEKNLATCWTNIVTACYVCNRKKANKTPKEANMSLKYRPIQPSYHPKYLPWYNQMSTISYDGWNAYISTNR